MAAALTRNEQTCTNERTTTPRSISGTNDHGRTKINIIAQTRLFLQSAIKKKRCSRLRPQSSYMSVLPFCSKNDNFLCRECALWKPKCTDKQLSFPSAVFCLHILYRSRSQQLQEAFIMYLAGSWKSQYSKNKNGFETWGAFKCSTIGPNITEMSSLLLQAVSTQFWSNYGYT